MIKFNENKTNKNQIINTRNSNSKEKNKEILINQESISACKLNSESNFIFSNQIKDGLGPNDHFDRKLSNFLCERNTNFSTNSILKNSEKYKILKLNNDELIEKIMKIISESKEYAIFFLSNSDNIEETKEKIKFFETKLKANFKKEDLLEIFQIFINLSEKADPKFKEYLFKCDQLGYNLTHYLSALSKKMFISKIIFC